MIRDEIKFNLAIDDFKCSLSRISDLYKLSTPEIMTLMSGEMFDILKTSKAKPDVLEKLLAGILFEYKEFYKEP
ncbi:MAG: hypothetical protein WC679_13250 [Bacteroidales bacterium]|jgi:hypothetical protein